MYVLYKLLRGTVAFNIFVGVVLLYGIWWLVGILDMNLLSMLLGRFVAFGVIILIIIFQPEVREFLLVLGNTTLKGRLKFLQRFFPQDEAQLSDAKVSQLDAIKDSLAYLSRSKTGALIVFSREPLNTIEATGVSINADISAPMLDSIFFKNSPLHDGAVLISGDKIRAGSCILPVSKNRDISQELGLRHRAAIGITENSNALAIIVSEETGQISSALRGNIRRGISNTDAKKIISDFLYSAQ